MKKLTAFLFLFFFASAQLIAQSSEQKIEQLVTAYAKLDKFNGTVLVAQKGKVLYEKGFGFRNAEDKVPNDINSIFQIGSLTKQFTSAIVMQLQQEKKLSLQDKLSKYFSGFPNGDKITIENLLTHTSGIYNYTNDTSIMKKDLTRHYTQKEMMDLFKSYPLDFEPGTKWNYSNSGYSILGYIIQKIENKPYETVVRERILRPLGMNNTGFDFTHLVSPDKTKGYFSLTPQIVPAPIVDSTIAFSAGALYSTVSDFYKWERAIYTNKILKPASWKAVFTPYKNKYGYGWEIDSLYGKLIIAHSGGIPGYASYILRFPQDEVAVIIFDNASSGVLSNISTDIAAIVFDKPYQIPEARKEIKLDTAILKQYVGEYQLSPTFIIKILLEGDGLKVQATGQPMVNLYAKKENIFFLKVADVEIEFVKDDKGVVTELILYQNGQQSRAKKIK